MGIWKDASHPNENVDIHVKAEDVRKVESILKSKGISFAVMIKDLQDAIMKEVRKSLLKIATTTISTMSNLRYVNVL